MGNIETKLGGPLGLRVLHLEGRQVSNKHGVSVASWLPGDRYIQRFCHSVESENDIFLGNGLRKIH